MRGGYVIRLMRMPYMKERGGMARDAMVGMVFCDQAKEADWLFGDDVFQTAVEAWITT